MSWLSKSCCHEIYFRPQVPTFALAGPGDNLVEQSTRQVAPSPVQVHALLLWVEQLLHELQGSGKPHPWLTGAHCNMH